MVNDLLAGMAIAEVMTLILALFTLFRQWNNTLSESGAYAIVVAMMLFSFLFQSGFMPGLHYPALIAEVLLLMASLGLILKRRGHIAADLRQIDLFARGHRVACGAVAVALGYLAVHALSRHPAAYHWDRLLPVLYCQMSHGFLQATTDRVASLPLYPINADVLSLLVLRFNTDMGLGIFGFLAYLSIGFSTYSLARRYAWPPTAFIAVLMVMSMPRFVYQSCSPGGEIVPAASSVFCILALYRLIEVPNIQDLFVLVVGICFSLTEDAACLTLPITLFIMAAILLIRRHGAIVWWHIIRRNRLAAISMLAPIMVFSQTWLFARNAFKGSNWTGFPDFATFAYNGDGILGATANFFRYLFQAADLTRPLDLLWQMISGRAFTDQLFAIYQATVTPLLGELGANAPFTLSSIPDEMYSWFGPAGFLLIPPAFLYVLIRGPRRLKATAIALGLYLYALCLITAWNPSNVRYFSIFFACTGFFVAFFLPPWRLTKTGRAILQVIAVSLLIYATAIEAHRPSVSLPELFHILQ